MKSARPPRILLVNPRRRLRFNWDLLEVSQAMGKKAASLPLALPLLAALTPKRFEVAILDEQIEALRLEPLPVLVGITAMISNIRRAHEIAAAFRDRGVPVVLGGPQVSFRPEESQPHADAIVVGEAEQVWEQLLQDLESGQLRQRYQAADFCAFRRSPPPRWDLVRTRSYLSFAVQVSRGCPHRCEFCLVRKLFGRRQRYRELDDVLAELRALPGRQLSFADDNLATDRQYLRRLCEGMEPLGLSWSCQAGVELARDPELLRAMARAGCTSVLVGFESLDPASLRQAGKDQNKAERYAQTVRAFHDCGMHVVASFVVGFDADTPRTFERIHRFSEENDLCFVMVNALAAYPGTDLHRRLQQEGRLAQVDTDLVNGMVPMARYRGLSRRRSSWASWICWSASTPGMPCWRRPHACWAAAPFAASPRPPSPFSPACGRSSSSSGATCSRGTPPSAGWCWTCCAWCAAGGPRWEPWCSCCSSWSRLRATCASAAASRGGCFRCWSGMIRRRLWHHGAMLSLPFLCSLSVLAAEPDAPPLPIDDSFGLLERGEGDEGAREALWLAGQILGDWEIELAGVPIDGPFLLSIAEAPAEEPLLRALRETTGRPIDLEDFLLFLDDVLLAEERRGECLDVGSGRARSAGILVHPDEVYKNKPRTYGRRDSLAVDTPPPQESFEPAADGDLLGPAWTMRFRNPSERDELLAALAAARPESDFAARAESLLVQLEQQDCQVWLTSTERSRERGYLMWGAYLLSRAEDEPALQAGLAKLENARREWRLDVPITWSHPQGWQATKRAARAMADAYDVVYATENGARWSRHYGGRAFDLVAVGLPRSLTLRAPDGQERVFDLSEPSQTRDLSLSPGLVSWIEDHFGFEKLRKDYPHWDDGG